MSAAEQLRAWVVKAVIIAQGVLAAGLYGLIGYLLTTADGNTADRAASVPDALWLAAGAGAQAIYSFLSNSKQTDSPPAATTVTTDTASGQTTVRTETAGASSDPESDRESDRGTQVVVTPDRGMPDAGGRDWLPASDAGYGRIEFVLLLAAGIIVGLAAWKVVLTYFA